VNDAVLDPLFWDLDCRDIAGIAKDGASAVTDLADDGDRNVPTDIIGIGAGELAGGESLEAFEIGAPQHEMDLLILGTGERAWSAFDTALDLELRAP
jgi:hypothetical protein